MPRLAATDGPLPCVREACVPREEVLRGGLVDKHFAAQLDQVVANAPGYHDYADADSFFKITHPTRGLKDLLAGTFARLSGNAAAAANAEHAVYRYETSFGGGKTHGLIALWHLACGARPPNLDEFIDPALLPSRCSAAAVVGDSLDPVNGLTTNGLTTYTLWGEIGRQLGPEAWALIQTSDEARTAPGKQVWLDMFGATPTVIVIVIDEIAQYLRQLASSARPDVNQMAKATIASLKMLFEAATAAPAVRIIVTLATGTAAFGPETTEITQTLNDVAAEQLIDEPKMSLLGELLAQSFADGHRTVVVFTQYADTLRYMRDRLVPVYGAQLVCYYGGRGERWSPESRQWAPIPKEEAKELFRRGDDVRIMLGTDSMSEGLNLQTCARVINFDLPWNFMRVEQRIGRVDRIGGQPKVEVTNLFYSDTVEEDIYRRIRDRLDWFTNVVGNAQPVLAATESVFEQAAMKRIDPAAAARELTGAADRLEQASLKLTDLDAVPEHKTALQPAMTLGDLQDILLSIRWCRGRFAPHPDFPDAWLLSLDDASPHPVTFNPARYQDTPHISLLTWRSPLLNRLLELASHQ